MLIAGGTSSHALLTSAYNKKKSDREARLATTYACKRGQVRHCRPEYFNTVKYLIYKIVLICKNSSVLFTSFWDTRHLSLFICVDITDYILNVSVFVKIKY